MTKVNGVNDGQTPTKKAENVSKRKVEPIFHEYSDGGGFPIKLANMNNPLICKREGVVEIECIKKTNTLEPRISISRVFDDGLGIWFGVPLGADPKTKEIKWQRFVIGDRKTYDLTKQGDAIEWAVVSRASWLIGSPYQKGKPLYRMYDRDAEAREIIVNSTIRSKAMEIAGKEIAIDEMMDMYRVFGKNPEGFSPLRLHAELIKIAEKNPKEFVNAWNNSNRSVLIIFNRAVALGLITMNINKGGYVWKDSLPLGLTEQAAMDYLIKNPQLLNQADLESKNKDNYRKKFSSMTNEEKEFFGADEVVVDSDLVQLRMTASLMNISGFESMSKGELESAIEESSGA